jgi:hypothetical protein
MQMEQLCMGHGVMQEELKEVFISLNYPNLSFDLCVLTQLC